MDRHSEAIELIETEISDLDDKLSTTAGLSSLVQRKDSLRNSLRLLRQLSEYEVAPKATIYSLPLPSSPGHFSEIRLLDDQETDDRAHWTELEIEGDPVRAIVGDILILNSKQR